MFLMMCVVHKVQAHAHSCIQQVMLTQPQGCLYPHQPTHCLCRDLLLQVKLALLQTCQTLRLDMLGGFLGWLTHLDHLLASLVFQLLALWLKRLVPLTPSSSSQLSCT